MDSVCTEISSASMATIASLSLSLHNMNHHLSPMKMEALNKEENVEESSQAAMEPCTKSDSLTDSEETKSTIKSSSSSSSSSISSSPAHPTVGLDPNASEFTPVNPSSSLMSVSSSSSSSSSSLLSPSPSSSSSIHLKTQPSLINMNPRIYDCHQPMQNAYNGLINVSHHANHVHPNYIPEPEQPGYVEHFSNAVHPNPNLAFNSALISSRQIMAPLVYPQANPSNLIHDACNQRGGVPPAIYIHNPLHAHHSSHSKEHISRALLMTGVPSGISEAAIREEIERSWGAIRSLQFERASEGIILVQFFDLRSAKQALKDMQSKHLLRQQRFRFNNEEISCKLHSSAAMAANASSSSSIKENPNLCMNPILHGIPTAEQEEGSCAAQEGSKGLICGHVVWAQYIAPWNMPVEDAHNQGTLVLFNVSSDISMRELREVFERFGNVRELREAPMKKQHKFVEFYDVRDAAAAWSSLNGQEICGKPMKIEFSKQGRLSNLSINGSSGMGRKNAKGSPYPPLTTIYHPNPVVTPPDHHHVNQDQCGWIHGDHHTFNGYHNMGYHPSYGMAMFPTHLEWQRSALDTNVRSPPLPIVTTNSFSTFDYDPMLVNHEEMMPPALMSYDHCHDMKGKTPASPANGYGGEVVAGPRRLRRSGAANSDPKCSSANTVDNHIGVENLSCSSEKPMSEAMREPHHHHHNHHHHQHSHRGAGNLHFEFDEREVYVLSGNPRTTLMIRNIPNKYSQQMLLSLLDKHCLDCNRRILDINEPESAYDFVYLPIDFKNRCNLGYAFVNFTTALATLKFYKSFNEQAWEAFNSRKICEIAYARVQGRPALEDHFRNSRFACDTDEYLPLVFVPPRNGIEFPMPRVAAGQSGPSSRGGRTDGRIGLGSVRRTTSSLTEGQKPEEPKDACSMEESSDLPHREDLSERDSCECTEQSEDLQEDMDSMVCCNESHSHDEQSCKFGDMEGGVDLDLAMSKLEMEA